MTKKQITIRMPKEDLELVLRTLRSKSNEHKQGRGALYNGAGYCCLGAMQCVKTGGFVEGHDSSGGDFLEFPSNKWLKSVGWAFKDVDGKSTDNPYFPTLLCTASEANDEENYTFKQIAQAIESCAVGY